MTTGAQRLVAELEAAGVEVVFGLPGVHNLAAWEALRQSDIRLVGVRHEQAAAYAADGYARATGKLGVALVTTGPGAANTLGAVGEAWAGGSAVLVIATDIPSTLRRPGVYRGVLHECADQRGMFAPVTKAQYDDSDTRQAIVTALTHPRRPVYLEIPTDRLSEERPGPFAPMEAIVEADVDVPAAAALCARAERPLIWAGGGAARDDAGEAVSALATALGAPVITTYQAAGLLGRDHPLAVGLPPHVPEAGALWDAADLVIAVGSDLDGVTTQNWRQPQPPALLAINVDAADAAKNYRADVVLERPAEEGTRLLLDALGEAREPWADVAAVRAGALERLRAEHPDELAFLDAFAAAVPDDAIVCADMCIPGYWLGALHPFARPRRLVYPLGWGTLGCAFPQALGASLAGDGPALSVSGDGGFLFACGELATMAQEQLPFTAVIVDDGGYGMLRFDQRQAGNETYGVDLRTPDFVALAESFGVRAERVEGLGGAFGDALAAHVADPAPSVLVATAALEPPPSTSPRWYRPA